MFPFSFFCLLFLESGCHINCVGGILEARKYGQCPKKCPIKLLLFIIMAPADGVSRMIHSTINPEVANRRPVRQIWPKGVFWLARFIWKNCRTMKTERFGRANWISECFFKKMTSLGCILERINRLELQAPAPLEASSPTVPTTSYCDNWSSHLFRYPASLLPILDCETPAVHSNYWVTDISSSASLVDLGHGWCRHSWIPGSVQ